MPEERKELEVVAVADFHGLLPKIRKADVLTIAGDIFPIAKHLSYKQVIFEQLRFAEDKFIPWLKKTLRKVDRIIIVGGNYDYILQQEMIEFPKGVVYLKDESYTYKGRTFYGFPWTPLRNSIKVAFTLPEKQLKRKAELIPDTDVLISHAPIYEYGDMNRSGRNKGLQVLREIVKKKDIKHLVCGHIHNGYGEYSYKGCSIHSVPLTEADNNGTYHIRDNRIQRFTLK